MTHTRFNRALMLTVWASIVLMASTAAQATVVSGSSSAFDASADLNALNLGNVSVGPFSEVSGNAPPPYDLNDSIVDATLGPAFGGQVSASAGVLETSAESNVDGNAGNRSATSSAIVTDLIVNAIGLNFTSDTIGSNAGVSGDFGALTATGSATLEDAQVSFGGNTFALPVNPDPNTAVLASVLNPLGISLVLNEQILGGNGTDSRSIEVNALHLALDDADLSSIPGLSDKPGLSDLSLVNGDIFVSHSQAQLLAQAPAGNNVDAPSGTAMLVLLGFALLGIALARHKAGFNA